ncbi:hypothetical protein ACGFYQ_39665 [Streptomyces sp. NPDC048258]|uniref:hypothetical protein n=1 Tax=Streptomyces sp. NPDC048258 TaxID=3365527 RepID=UPI00371C725F
MITTNEAHPSNWFGTQGSPVLPARVVDSIHTALTAGWMPENPGLPFHLNQSAGFVSPH